MNEVFIEHWNINTDAVKRNYDVVLRNDGWWPMQNMCGKWLCIFKVSEGHNSCPTLLDQYNFLTGLLECERRNDDHRIRFGFKPQLPETLKKLQECIKVYDDIKCQLYGGDKHE